MPFDRKRKGKKRTDLQSDSEDLDTDFLEDDDEHQEIDWDNQSSTIVGEDTEDRTHILDDTDARKAAKAERKLAKNQVRFDVIIKEDLDRIQEALHPDFEMASEDAIQGQGLFNNYTIEQNIAFNAGTFKYGALRQSVHAKKSMKNNSPHKKGGAVDTKQAEESTTAILRALGIKTDLAKATKERKVLDVKLRNAIMSDLVAFENEQAETMERMAGYWRYANRRTYNQMVENNELWDWATGQKLLQIEEESDLDTIDEEDKSAEEEIAVGTTPGTTPSLTPEDWDNIKDFKFPITAGHIVPDPNFQDGDGLRTPTQAAYTRCSTDAEQFTEMTRSHFDELRLSKLSYSPGRSPGPTLTFYVPSPSSSDDDPFEEKKVHFPTATPTVRPSAFGGKKDTRTANRVAFIREASPPQEQTETPDPKFRRNIPSPTTVPPSCADISNRFGNLDCELPAPCDVQKPVVTPSKAKVLNLALPPKQTAPEAEDGWELIQSAPKRNNKSFPCLEPGKKKKGAGAGGGGSPVQKQNKNGTSWAKVVAAKK